MKSSLKAVGQTQAGTRKACAQQSPVQPPAASRACEDCEGHVKYDVFGAAKKSVHDRFPGLTGRVLADVVLGLRILALHSVV